MSKTLAQNIEQAINDFDSIKAGIIEKGVSVPDGTPTSQYGDLIKNISGGGTEVTGTKEITDTSLTDVSTYQYAQVVDANLVPENIKAGTTILGVSGSAATSDSPVAQFGAPWIGIDWENDKLYVVANPFYNPLSTYGYDLYDNNEKIVDNKQYQINTRGATSNGGNQMVYYAVGSGSLDLTTLSTGIHSFKAQTHSKTTVGGDELSFSTSYLGTISSISFTRNYLDVPDSVFSNVIEYARWNYQINLSDINYDKSTSGILNSSKTLFGELYTYNKTVVYSIDTKPISSLKPNTSSNTWTSVQAYLSNDVLYAKAPSGKNYYNSSFAKVYFTISESKNIDVKYQVNTASANNFGVVLGALDKDYTSVSYSSKLSSPVLDYTGSKITDTVEHTYTYENVSAGEHFYWVQFYRYTTTDTYQATVTPIYEQVDTGKYLPSDITVTNSNETEPEYTWDPYTGEFLIPMTGNITMTATASDTPLLEKLTVTPATWDVETSTLTWDYSVDGITYHILTPNGTEYTTTEKSFDFTGKLGEASIENKKIKIWAENTNSEMSGICIVRVYYNPSLTELFDHIEYKTRDDIGIPTGMSYWGTGIVNNEIYYPNGTDQNIKALKYTCASNTTSQTALNCTSNSPSRFFGSNMRTLSTKFVRMHTALLFIANNDNSALEVQEVPLGDGGTRSTVIVCNDDDNIYYLLPTSYTSDYIRMFSYNGTTNSYSELYTLDYGDLVISSSANNNTGDDYPLRTTGRWYYPVLVGNYIYLFYYGQGEANKKHLKIDVSTKKVSMLVNTDSSSRVIFNSVPYVENGKIYILTRRSDTTSWYMNAITVIDTTNDTFSVIDLDQEIQFDNGSGCAMLYKVGNNFIVFSIKYVSVGSNNVGSTIYRITSDGKVTTTKSSLDDSFLFRSGADNGYSYLWKGTVKNGKIYLPRDLNSTSYTDNNINCIAVYTP